MDWEILGIIGLLAFIALVGIVIVAGIDAYLTGISYNNEAGSYYNLAVDSSTATLKLEYLKDYRKSLSELKLENGYGAWLWKLPDKKIENQIKVLDSIIERLRKIIQMDEGSFEYQQALYQISRNDLCHRGSAETTGCFREAIIECKYILDRALLGGIFCP